MDKKIGFTIGKFAPLHKGHQYLIETALKEMDIFYVIVYDTDVINISSEIRAEWIKKLYPEVKIIIAHNPPSMYGLDYKSVQVQMKYLVNVLGNIKPTHFYSSEKYGIKVAEYMHIINREVDINRKLFPISATLIRNNIDNYKDMVDSSIYNDMKK